jgi:hypothetical protein
MPLALLLDELPPPERAKQTLSGACGSLVAGNTLLSSPHILARRVEPAWGPNDDRGAADIRSAWLLYAIVSVHSNCLTLTHHCRLFQTLRALRRPANQTLATGSSVQPSHRAHGSSTDRTAPTSAGSSVAAGALLGFRLGAAQTPPPTATFLPLSITHGSFTLPHKAIYIPQPLDKLSFTRRIERYSLSYSLSAAPDRTPGAHTGAGLKQLLRGIWANAPWEPVAVITRAPPPSASVSKPVDADAASPSAKKALTREHGSPLVLVPLGTTQERTLSALCVPPQLPPLSSFLASGESPRGLRALLRNECEDRPHTMLRSITCHTGRNRPRAALLDVTPGSSSGSSLANRPCPPARSLSVHCAQLTSHMPTATVHRSKREVNRLRDAGMAANAAATASTNLEGTAAAACSLEKLLDTTATYLFKSVGAGLGAHVLVVTAHCADADAAFNVPQSVFSVMRPPWLRVHVLHVTDASTGSAPAHSTLQVCSASDSKRKPVAVFRQLDHERSI